MKDLIAKIMTNAGTKSDKTDKATTEKLIYHYGN